MRGRYFQSTLLLLVSTIVFLSSTAVGAATENEAKKILRSMSEYIGRTQSLELSFDSSIEVITPQLEKIQFTNSGNMQLTRPNKIHAHRVGAHANVELFFDGTTVSVFDNKNIAYAQFESPGNLNQLFENLASGHGIALPGADLLLSNSYDILIADVIEAKHIGKGIINGIECEHLAFRNHDTDWQIWIESSARPIPRKLIITSKTINSGPQYSVQIGHWNTKTTPNPEVFTFIPPSNAAALNPDDLIGLDELPHTP